MDEQTRAAIRLVIGAAATSLALETPAPAMEALADQWPPDVDFEAFTVGMAAVVAIATHLGIDPMALYAVADQIKE